MTIDNETIKALYFLIGTIGQYDHNAEEDEVANVFMLGDLAEINGLPEAWLTISKWMDAHHDEFKRIEYSEK